MYVSQPALQEILFGAFVPPTVIDTRRHQFGLVGFPRYVPPAKTNRNKNGLNDSEQKVLDALNKIGRPVSAATMTGLVKMTRSHCGMVLCSLFKMGLLTRNKARENGMLMYVYNVKSRQVE